MILISPFQAFWILSIYFCISLITSLLIGNICLWLHYGARLIIAKAGYERWLDDWYMTPLEMYQMTWEGMQRIFKKVRRKNI
jgi:hypothetical protein